jgi:hypothetical protein
MRLTSERAPAHSAATSDEECELHRRISAEFREMPGLTLTLAQAARLFNLEPTRCERLLRSLVEGGVLITDGRAFARADSGRRST